MGAIPAVRHLLRARDLVDARYFELLRVEDMAHAAGLSRAHFSGEFRRAFGESPHAYLLTRRLERAAAAAHNRSFGGRDLCFCGAAQRRLLHDEFHARLRHAANGLP